jgi:chromosome segregation ATPase
MTVSRPNVSPRALSVDTLFARLHDERVGYATTLPSGGGPEGQASGNGTASLAEQQPPPTLKDPADLQVAHEWLKAERARLEAYTRSQFAAIQQQHQSLLAKQFRSEEALALRAQELNREMKFLASQSEALQWRARELAEREVALSAHMEKLAGAEQEFLAIQQTGSHAGEATKAHRALLERLRADMAQLQAAGADAHKEAAAFEAALRERQEAWEKKHAAQVARQEEMEQRYTALEKAEEASQRRLTELDELEELLRTEFEQQEKRLAHERQEIDVLRTKLRVQIRKLEEGLDEAEDDAVPV